MKNQHGKGEINHSFKPETNQIITQSEDSISELDEEERIRQEIKKRLAEET